MPLSRRIISLGKSVLAAIGALACVALIHHYTRSNPAPVQPLPEATAQSAAETLASQTIAARQALELAPVPVVDGSFEMSAALSA